MTTFNYTTDGFFILKNRIKIVILLAFLMSSNLMFSQVSSITCEPTTSQITDGVSGTFGSENALFSDGFEYEESTNLIAWPHNESWSTLTGTEEGSAVVSDLHSNGGSNSLKITEANDFVLKMGNKNSGSYLLKWKMHIPTGSTARICLSEDESGVEDMFSLAYYSGFSTYFNEFTHALVGQSPFSHDTWFDAVAYFDLDNDIIKVYIDDELKIDIDSIDFNLGAVNFLQGGAGFYIDDVEYLDLNLSNDPATFVSDTNSEVIVTYADPLYLDCSNTGLNVITLKSLDLQGNITVCESDVTVQDNLDPIPPTLLDITAECSASAPVPTAIDACAGLIYGTTDDEISYDADGEYTITWTFDDGNGNSVDVSQNIMIIDHTKPQKMTNHLPHITSSSPVESLPIPTAFDNCDGIINGTTDVTFPITNTTMVWWEYIDNSGNKRRQNQRVKITNEAPTANNSLLMDPSTSDDSSGDNDTPDYIENEISTNIENVFLEESLNVYPNPNSGAFTFKYISSKTGEGINIRLVNTSGQIIYSKEIEKNSMEFENRINGVASGVYYLIINADDTVLRKKIVVS